MIYDFEYLPAGTLQEALKYLDEYGDDCKVICGGQSLLIILRQGLIQPEYLIDIKGVKELDYIKQDNSGGLKIGATTTHRSIENSPEIQKSFSVLSNMEHRLASAQTRNWGTIGGNLAHADPAGDPAPIFIALNSTLALTGSGGERTMPAEDFFLDYFETALEHGELLTEIQVPALPARTGVAYSKFNVISSEMPTVSAAVSVTLAADDTCEDIRIALGAAAPVPLRAKKAEEIVRGNKITAKLLKEAGVAAAEAADPISDIHASEEYRLELVKVLTMRVGMEALAKAQQA
ncbi:MAG: xanthine dehydrogenase family protein subunit M [Dehalococcoidales bacterium]|nr:xanthine dehydrogenase family protein subunit M [Dehalococcoidales bacterium]